MPNDQFGRPVAIGDTVILKGEVVKVLDDPNFINCTVKLAQQMPPGGTETNIQLNTAQVEKQGGEPKKAEAPKSSSGAEKAEAPKPSSGAEKPSEPPHPVKK